MGNAARSRPSLSSRGSGASASLPEERRGDPCLLFTGKIILERGEQVPNDWDTPRPAKQLLASSAPHVGHVRVVEGEAKNPAGAGEKQSLNLGGNPHVGACISLPYNHWVTSQGPTPWPHALLESLPMLLGAVLVWSHKGHLVHTPRPRSLLPYLHLCCRHAHVQASLHTSFAGASRSHSKKPPPFKNLPPSHSPAPYEVRVWVLLSCFQEPALHVDAEIPPCFP